MKIRILIIALLALLLIPTVAYGSTYSRAKTREIVTEAGHYYHLSNSAIKWLKNAAIDIIYTGHHESGGSTSCRSGSCVGIFQFNTSWHLTGDLKKLRKRRHILGDWRKSGVLSIYRFVRVYRDGGKHAIRKHWKATLGR